MNCAIDQADAHRADRAEERNVGEGQRGGSGVDAEHVGIVIGVGGEHEGDDLGLALEAFGEHRTHRPVDLAAGENFALAHAAFALDEAAGKASAGVGVFAVINGEGKEIDAFARDRHWRWRWREQRFRPSAPRPSRAPAWLIFRFQRRVVSAGEFDGNFGSFWFHVSSFRDQRAASS